jgi:hypothetical protein
MTFNRRRPLVDVAFLLVILVIFGAGMLGWPYFFLALIALAFLRGSLGLARMLGFKRLG